MAIGLEIEPRRNIACSEVALPKTRENFTSRWVTQSDAALTVRWRRLRQDVRGRLPLPLPRRGEQGSSYGDRYAAVNKSAPFHRWV